MGEIQISKRSQELINTYIELYQSHLPQLLDNECAIDFDLLVSWLQMELVSKKKLEKVKQDMDFLLTKIRAELLHDLNSSMAIARQKLVKVKAAPATSTNKLKFILLAISGTILAACEGFDSVTTMMGLLSIPSWTILLAGLAFSLLSVVVFYGFELAQVSKSLGVNLTDAPKLLDIYLSQLEEIKSIRRKMNTYSLSRKSLDELTELNKVIEMLKLRFVELSRASKEFKLTLESNVMMWSKYIFSGLAALLFFGSGFFAGQSVGIFIAGFFVASVTPGMWPVVLVSLLVGCAAFNLYWYWERSSLETLISGWFGLDEDKIEILCNEEKLNKEEEELDNLKQKIMDASELTSKVIKLEYNAAGEKKEHQSTQSQAIKPSEKPKISFFYSFFSGSCDSMESHEQSDSYVLSCY